METTKEISALFTLLDDPDEDVFGAVTEKIVGYGCIIIPNLEHLWETTPDSDIQDRIELLIHKLHYKDLYEDFRQWGLSGYHDLFLGTLLTAKFQYPDLATIPVQQEIEKVRRNIWLELNNYLTPLEQVKIVTSILYSYYGLKGGETAYTDPNDFLIHKVLESKKGNQVGNGILYLVLSELLDIPVRAVNIPRQFVLAYMKPGYSDETIDDPREKIEFFIDPSSGQVFTHHDVETYFNRIAAPLSASYFRPQSNKKIVRRLLEELGKCFTDDKNLFKQSELQQLAELVS